MIAVAQRFPLAPLERLACVDNLAELAVKLGLTHRAVQRLDERGLRELEADRYAVALNLHPSNVWPEWGASAPGEEDLASKRCRCGVANRVPVGDICDRCGRSLRVPAVRPRRHAA